MFAGGFCAADRADHLLARQARGPGTRRRNQRMSLINDALKKASETKPPLQAEVNATLQPVEHRPRSLWVSVWCVVGIMCAGFLATWAIVMGLVANNQIKAHQPVSITREAPNRLDSASTGQNS